MVKHDYHFLYWRRGWRKLAYQHHGDYQIMWWSLSSKSTVDGMKQGTEDLFWGSWNYSRKEEASSASIFGWRSVARYFRELWRHRENIWVYIHSCKWTFRTEKNLSYERFKFHSAATNSSEGFLSYLTRLKKLARSCNFDNYSTGDAIVQHYTCTCGSDTVKRKLLSNENLDLATMTLKVSSIELVESQVKVMDHKPNCYEEVNEISNRGTGKRVFICYGCGEPGHAIHSTDCPARDCRNLSPGGRQCNPETHFGFTFSWNPRHAQS